jgi:thioredoxin reductase (NADPH)
MYMGLQPGGQLTITNDVEFFRLRRRRDGSTDDGRPEKWASRFGTDVRYGIATAVDFSVHRAKSPLTSRCDGRHRHHRHQGFGKVAGYSVRKRLNGSGVSACAVRRILYQERKSLSSGPSAAEAHLPGQFVQQ